MRDAQQAEEVRVKLVERQGPSELISGSDEAAVLGDPNFPEFGTKRQTLGAQLFLFTGLYEDYSRLAFTHEVDKPVAIAAMEQRLTQKIITQETAMRSGAGIFASHEGRWLLWQRAKDVLSLKRIDFSSSKVKAPPSWSWMSYIGGIEFLDPPQGKTTWNQSVQLTLTGDGSTSWLYTKEPLRMKASVIEVSDAHAAELAIHLQASDRPTSAINSEVSLMIDAPEQLATIKHFVVIGVSQVISAASLAYVLVVKLRQDGISYERLGAGSVPHRMVSTGATSPQVLSTIV